MKITRWAYLISFLFFNFTSQDKINKIFWSKNIPLQWKDFMGSPKQNQGFAAMTSYCIETAEEEGRVYINCSFDKKKSWRIKKKESENLLRHEQYHFNIAEVYARKMRKTIIDHKTRLGAKEFTKIFKSTLNECETAQKKYDKDTNHSIIFQEQTKWENNTDKQLEELSNFSNPLIY